MTNIIIQTTSCLIPIDDKIYHSILGIITSPHPDLWQAKELIEFQLDSSAHCHICSWKRCLQGTVIKSIDGKSIKSRDDIVTTVKQAKQEHKKIVKVEFGSLAGFARSGEGIPTLQINQMNVIAHHNHSIRMKQYLWPQNDQTKWPINIDSPESIEQQIQIAKLQQQKLKLQADWNGFLQSEWKQLGIYNDVGMFGDPVKRTLGYGNSPLGLDVFIQIQGHQKRN